MFSDEKPLLKIHYAIGVAVIFLAVFSQYFIRLGVVAGYFVVYGIPILVVGLMFGKSILRKAGKNNKDAFKYGLGLFGALTLLSVFFSLVALAIILQIDPKAMDLLSKPNPVLDIPPNVALAMIAVSILVIGPAEEFLFRGFMYGGLLNISKGHYWLPLAVVSSLMFASVHAYYFVTYGIASAVSIIDLVCFGVAMAVTYYWTGGNILAAAVIHGVYDATGFLGVATTTAVGIAARGILIGLGVLMGVMYLPKKIRLTPAQVPSETPPDI
jgi:membrane protease YdiL (CAAX protease family)